MPFKFQNQIKLNSHGLLAVSIGQKNQTGERFLEEVRAVLACNELTTVSVFKADSLQRFHYMAKEGLSEQAALEKAMLAAKQWESDNQQALALLKEKGGNVYSYQDFFELSKEYREQVLALYASDKTFKNKVDSIARNFTRDVKKKMGDGAEEHHDRIFKAMKDFMLEESGIYIYLSNHVDNFEYIVYPGAMPSPVTYACKKFIDNGRAIHMRLVYHEPEVRDSQKNGNVFTRHYSQVQGDQCKATMWNGVSKDNNDDIKWQNLVSQNIDTSQLDDELIKELTTVCNFIFGNVLENTIRNEKLGFKTKQAIRNNLVIDLIKFMREFMEKTLQETEEVANKATQNTNTDSPKTFGL